MRLLPISGSIFSESQRMREIFPEVTAFVIKEALKDLNLKDINIELHVFEGSRLAGEQDALAFQRALENSAQIKNTDDLELLFS